MSRVVLTKNFWDQLLPLRSTSHSEGMKRRSKASFHKPSPLPLLSQHLESIENTDCTIKSTL